MRTLTPLILLALRPVFAADTPQTTDVRQAMEASIAQQRQATAAMVPSLTAQRASIARQVGQASPESFFLLGPPGLAGLPLNHPPNYDCDPLSAAEIDSLVSEAATRENLQPELLRSVVQQESGFRPCVVSPKGAMGLMQLMPATAAQLGIKEPFSPKDNIQGGAHLLKQLLGIYDLPTALAAYNAGSARVDATGGIPNIPETLEYIQKVLSLLPIGH